MKTSDPKKTIFITVYDGAIARNHLRTDVLPLLNREARIVIFCPRRKVDYYKKTFASDSVFVEASPPATNPYFENIFWALSYHSIPTRTIKICTIHNFWSEGKKRKLYYGIKRFLNYVGHIRLWRRFLRKIYHVVPDHSFDPFFEKYQPDLVFAPNMVSHEDMRMLKGAKKRGIKTVGMMKSWDNLTTKAFVAVHPEKFLTQNEIIKNDLIQLVDYPAEQITVVGFPQFDRYRNRSQLLPRDEFLRSVGLDPTKKTILYAAAGDIIAPKDPEVIDALVRMVQSGVFGEDVQILLRPHPKYVCHEERFRGISFVKVDRPGMYLQPDHLGSWEFEQGDIEHFINSMAHADVIVNSASTTCMEAAIFDLPVVSIAFDGANSLPYPLSLRRFYDFECIQRLMASDGISVAYSVRDLERHMAAYLKNRSYNKDGREKIVQEHCGPMDGKAGERIARVVLGALES